MNQKIGHASINRGLAFRFEKWVSVKITQNPCR